MPDTALTARARMPLAFQPRQDEAPTPFVSLLRRLIDIGGLGGVQESEESDAETGATSEAARRLHTKLDLLLWMGAELLAVHRPLPPNRSVELHSDRLLLETDGSDSGDERRWLLLYCLDGLPLPLPLPVRCSADGDRLDCTLDAPDAATAELYSPLLFRLHRREIPARRPS